MKILENIINVLYKKEEHHLLFISGIKPSSLFSECKAIHSHPYFQKSSRIYLSKS